MIQIEPDNPEQEKQRLLRLIRTIEQVAADAVEREHYELAASLTEAKSQLEKEIDAI